MLERERVKDRETERVRERKNTEKVSYFLIFTLIMLILRRGHCAGRCFDEQCILYMCLTDRCQLGSASHIAVRKSVKRLNTHIVFEIICIY